MFAAASLLTFGVLFSFLFSIIILVLQVTQNLNIFLAIGLTVVVNVILWLISPWLTDLMNRFFYKVRFLKKEEMDELYPELSQFIQSISAKHRFPYPKIGIIDDQNPTAFTYGSGRYNARIVLTEGLFTYLSPQETKAVVAHELGHIVNRDFVVMMIASTIVQILYEIYAHLIRVKGKKSGNIKLVALLAYAFYTIGIYLILFLSRTREYMADTFAAQTASAQDLSNALIKIAYGIVAAPDTDASKRLLHSTRHLGIIDVNNAKHLGVTAYITHQNPERIAEVMVFDRVNPWAKIIELNSTHPLTGKRIDNLSTISKKQGKPFSYDVDAATSKMKINKSVMYMDFMQGVVIYYAPLLLSILLMVLFGFVWIPAGIGIGILIQTMYRFPQEPEKQTTILDQMRNPYASPIRGTSIRLTGNAIGRGMPGYIFSEDVMYQDSTGLIFLDYSSLFGFIGKDINFRNSFFLSYIRRSLLLIYGY